MNIRDPLARREFMPAQGTDEELPDYTQRLVLAYGNLADAMDKMEAKQHKLATANVEMARDLQTARQVLDLAQRVVAMGLSGNHGDVL